MSDFFSFVGITELGKPQASNPKSQANPKIQALRFKTVNSWDLKFDFCLYFVFCILELYRRVTNNIQQMFLITFKIF